MHREIKNLKFFEQLTNLPFIEEIWLFGSRARQDNQKRSDIDIAIYCPKANNKDWLDILEIIENADTLLEIDCIRLDSLKNTGLLKNNILEPNIRLYKSNEKH